MIIVIDIGNTSIKLGFIEKMKILSTISIPTDKYMHSADSIGMQLLVALGVLKKSTNDIEAFVLSSVVPFFDAMIAEMTLKFFNKETLSVNKEIIVPLENRYDSPLEVGADRLVAAYAASTLFSDKANNACSFISVDFGTATTFDCIDNKAYLGGLICPGVQSSHSALTEKAAKLPKIALETEANFPEIGKNTALSISHGFIFGFVAMTEGLLNRLTPQLSSKPFIVATGGFAPSIAKHLPSINVVEPNLILLGLASLFYNNTNT